uniref:NR LBD domain-containing protein n=1 Tax=Meloidogyne enterolobii TaxID=390850 RepID=A0A6V7W9C6_MELEN|nr:unnamed protein product [Meloidogyne enterolobii]
MFNSRVQKCMLVGRLLCVGIAKSLPVFEKLTLSDQVAHLREAFYVFNSFTSSYIAWELGSETWTRKDCVMPALSLKMNNEFLHDDNMIKWSDYSFTKSVAYFKRAALTKIEFALLIAIIFTISNTRDLSVEGKDLLLDEFTKYTNILLRYNQRKLGLIEGAQRLAECSELIIRSIENECALRLMFSHQLKNYSMGANYFKVSNFFENFFNKTD